ncbi:MAG: AAA family ATPase [Actinobacteria bacterium]|nr:AAA family ATPase [Actinomycetota bacterium]
MDIAQLQIRLAPMIRERIGLTILGALLFVIVTTSVAVYVASGRSPHRVLRTRDSDVRLRDVVGASAVKREAIDALHLFLNHATFQDRMGGTGHRGVLFEGASGTGKTYIAKALAAEAEVALLVVSANQLQSMFPGQTKRKIRSFFKALRRAARADGGAIGLIDDFELIGSARAGTALLSSRDGASSIVFELLAEMDRLATWQPRRRGRLAQLAKRLLPSSRASVPTTSREPNVLVIATTSRAAELDAALVVPGRFDRTIHFDLPPRSDRLAVAEFHLARKSHELSVSAALVGDLTAGYTPSGIERLLDEALIVALQDNRVSMRYHDVIAAQLITEVGVAQEVGYHPDERRRVAIHQAGHALTAALVGRDVKLASILRRSGVLGMVQHGDVDERFLRTPSEARDIMMVTLAGRAAEVQEFGEASSGVADDLRTATVIAAELVGLLGAGDTLLNLGAAMPANEGNVVEVVLADSAARAKAEGLMNAAADRAACAVLEHRRALLALADALVEQDELSGDEVHIIVAGALTS